MEVIGAHHLAELALSEQHSAWSVCNKRKECRSCSDFNFSHRQSSHARKCVCTPDCYKQIKVYKEKFVILIAYLTLSYW